MTVLTVTNPSFEDALTGWTIDTTADSPASVAVASAFEGDDILYAGSMDTGEYARVFQDITIDGAEIGNDFTLASYGYDDSDTSTTNQVVFLEIEMYDASDVLLDSLEGRPDLQSAGPRTWMQNSITLLIPATTAYARIYVGTERTAGSGFTTYWHDVVSAETTTPVVVLDPNRTVSSQMATMAVISDNPPFGTRTAELAALAVFTQIELARQSATSQLAAIAPTEDETNQGSRTTTAAVMAVYGDSVREQLNARAWGFQLDGHSFYVLHLGVQGTFVYDATTDQWSQWSTQGFTTWNMEHGWTWFNKRVVAGAEDGPSVFELDPNSFIDEGFRTIFRAVTGIVSLRGRGQRASVGVGALRITASPGPSSGDAPELSIRWSDDQGRTWSQPMTLTLDQNQTDQDLSFRSLGNMTSPGRVWEVYDVGGLVRISDATLDVGDEDAG